MDSKTLQYLMVHSVIWVTLNTYTHLGFDDAKNEMVRLGGTEGCQERNQEGNGQKND